MPRQGLSLIDQKLPKLQHFKNVPNFDFFSRKLWTLWTPYLCQWMERELLYCTRVICKVYRCASSRFRFDLPNIVKITAPLKRQNFEFCYVEVRDLVDTTSLLMYGVRGSIYGLLMCLVKVSV